MRGLTPELTQQCWDALMANAPDSVSWNHYDLAGFTEITDINIWKTFLLDARVQEWLEEERAILQQYELAKLTQGASTSRSVGQAQLINSLERLNAANKNKTANGPIFIYTYIPLNAEQRAAPNVNILDEDIFLDKPDFSSPITFEENYLQIQEEVPLNEQPTIPNFDEY